MANIITRGPERDWGFVGSESEGARSRDNGTLKGGQGIVKAGTVLSYGSGGDAGKLVIYSGGRNTAGDVILPVEGVLGRTTDTGTVADGDAKDVYVAYLSRDAEVNFENMFYPAETTTGNELLGTVQGLKAKNIIPRGEHTGVVIDGNTEL